jgi:hypothetical protein
MPIDAAELVKAANAHVIRPAHDTVYQTLKAWRATADSYEWWWLIIQHDNRRYTAIRFEGLRDVLTYPGLNVTMNTPLTDLPSRRDNPADWERPFPGVVTPTVVEQTAMGTAHALQIMQDSPGQVLVVLHDGQFRGILSGSQRTFAFSDKPLLDMLDEFEQHGDDDTLILPPRLGGIPPSTPDTSEPPEG